MELPLHPETARRLQDLVSSGAYRSIDEVIEEAMGLLEGRDKTREQRLSALRADIERGMEDLRAGRTTDADVALPSLKSRLGSHGSNGA